MILDIILILLLVLICFIGYKVGFLATFIKITSIFSGLIIAILFTKPVANFPCSIGLDDGISNNIYTNIIESEPYKAYFASGGGVEGISDLLIQLGIPEFISGFVAKGIVDNTNPEAVALSVSNSLGYASTCVIVFLFLLFFSSIIFWIIKLIVKKLRDSITIVRVIDGILGICIYAILFIVVIYVLFLILSLILQSLPGNNEFAEFIREQLHLGTDEFGIAKYFYEHNFLGNLLKLFL